MILPVILLFLGLMLILFEFYLPGAIMGTLGAVAIIVSIFVFASEYSWPFVLLYILISILLVGLLIRFALWKIVRAKPERSIYLHGDQEGYQASSFDLEAIGKSGIVSSDLKPGGYILIGSKQHQAISISGYISKGGKVKVLSGEGESLIVKEE